MPLAFAPSRSRRSIASRRNQPTRNRLWSQSRRPTPRSCSELGPGKRQSRRGCLRSRSTGVRQVSGGFAWFEGTSHWRHLLVVIHAPKCLYGAGVMLLRLHRNPAPRHRAFRLPVASTALGSRPLVGTQTSDCVPDGRFGRLYHLSPRDITRRPRKDSNLRTRFRKPMLYPLSYGGESHSVGVR
jgi:hypothetical protein